MANYSGGMFSENCPRASPQLALRTAVLGKDRKIEEREASRGPESQKKASCFDFFHPWISRVEYIVLADARK
jgi:hypothetical protein